MHSLVKIALGCIFLAMTAGQSASYNVNGQYFSQVSCSYQFNSDFNTGGYVGVYTGPSGSVYSWFFPSDQYSWCPY